VTPMTTTSRTVETPTTALVVLRVTIGLALGQRANKDWA
jgi:hypothetical protein